MDTEPAGQFFNAFDTLFTSFADDIGCAKFFCQFDAVGVSSHDDNLLSAETLGSDDAAQSNSSVADDSYAFAGTDVRSDGCMMAGAHNIGKRKERREESFILRHFQGIQRTVGLRY